MAEYYKNGKMVSATWYKEGEHIVADNGEEHVIQIITRYKRDGQGLYTYEVREVDDQYLTNNLGIVEFGNVSKTPAGGHVHRQGGMMIKAALIDEGSIEKYGVTEAEPAITPKNFTACKTIGRYDELSPLVIQLWNGKTLVINPSRVIWTLHEFIYYE